MGIGQQKLEISHNTYLLRTKEVDFFNTKFGLKNIKPRWTYSHVFVLFIVR